MSVPFFSVISSLAIGSLVVSSAFGDRSPPGLVLVLVLVLGFLH